MTTQTNKQTIAFEAGSEYLNVITMRQSGSIYKGIGEAIQNAADSKATVIKVNIDNDGFSVIDDGFGFADETHVDKYFAEVGFDHSEGIHADEDRIGFFGLGRFQLCSFAPVTWRSNTFAMKTDFLKQDSSSFEKTVGLEQLDGCTVSGQWYQPIQNFDVEQQCKAIARLFEFFEVPVILNGEPLTSPDMTWDIETDSYKIKFAKHSNNVVDVFNRGVFVNSLDYGDMHGATVVSKKNLMLNTARDNVLVAKCPIFKEVAKELRAKANEQMHKRPYNSFKVRDFHLFLNALLDGEFDHLRRGPWSYKNALLSFRVIPTPKGMISISKLLEAKYVKVFNNNSFTKDDLKITSDVVFVSPTLLTNTNSPSLDVFLARLKNKLIEMYGASAVGELPQQASDDEMLNILQDYKHKKTLEVEEHVETQTYKASLATNAMRRHASHDLLIDRNDDSLYIQGGKGGIKAGWALTNDTLEGIADGGFPDLFAKHCEALAAVFNKNLDENSNDTLYVPSGNFRSGTGSPVTDTFKSLFKGLSNLTTPKPVSN